MIIICLTRVLFDDNLQNKMSYKKTAVKLQLQIDNYEMNDSY